MVELVEVVFKGERREVFQNRAALTLKPGDLVVVAADRGEDLGRVVRKGPDLRRKREGKKGIRELIRLGTEEDRAALLENRSKEEDAFRICEERIRERELKMKLVDVEYQFDGNKITFYFTAEKRVDFRELVRDLAARFKTRIELRQIGVRDEARRLGGMGTCGRELCCATFLKEFEPVTLRMAKDQQLALNPSKISGACGRLMCCLMYEVGFYREIGKSLPKTGTTIAVDGVELEVSRVDVLRHELIAKDDQGREVKLDIPETGEVSIEDEPEQLETIVVDPDQEQSAGSKTEREKPRESKKDQRGFAKRWFRKGGKKRGPQ